MNRTDRRRWASARTLADLGELTAQWLEGSIASQPGYAPGCGPDPETADLIPVLAACNRAGFVTDSSQPGAVGPGWDQRAAAEGFASPQDAERLRAVAQDAGLLVRVQQPTRWRYSRAWAFPVTTSGTRYVTCFAVRLPRRHIRDAHLGYGICHPDAVGAICRARQVAVIDRDWGRNDRLWPALAEFAKTTTEEAAS